MEYKYLQSKISNGIATLTISREKALNALNNETIGEIEHYFQYEAIKEEVKGVILTGAGSKAFVAGADIKGFLALSAAELEELSRYGSGVFLAIENFHKPVIAAINGFALGGGLELAMACHFRIASDNARFGQPEVNLGIIPGYGGTQRLVDLIGKGKAMELLMTADMIKADEALRLGLVNKVSSQEELLETAQSIMEKITSKGPLAVANIIECVNAHFDPSKDGYDMEAKAFGKAALTNDFKEGVTAFIEKRAAQFKGN